LFEQTNTYDAAYKWFDSLTAKGAGIIGYVIMPTLLHLLVHLPSAFKTPNAVAGTTKRFLSYEIVKHLEANGAEPLLQELHAAVKKREARKGRVIGCLKKALIARSATAQNLLSRNWFIYIITRGKGSGVWWMILPYTRTAVQDSILVQAQLFIRS
jgi:hypothetical protein